MLSFSGMGQGLDLKLYVERPSGQVRVTDSQIGGS